MKIRILSASGITLIELLLVMALLSLAAAFVGPAVGAGLDSMALRSTGLGVVSTLRKVQSDARRGQKTRAVRAAGSRLVSVSDDGAEDILEFESGVRVAGGEEATYMVFGSGQIAGPQELELENSRAAASFWCWGPSPGCSTSPRIRNDETRPPRLQPH
jgi:prepilin-type N-terminal cleavage/methylation domain-containing protein